MCGYALATTSHPNRSELLPLWTCPFDPTDKELKYMAEITLASLRAPCLGPLRLLVPARLTVLVDGLQGNLVTS